jgi:hypothetical protein
MTETPPLPLASPPPPVILEANATAGGGLANDSTSAADVDNVEPDEPDIVWSNQPGIRMAAARMAKRDELTLPNISGGVVNSFKNRGKFWKSFLDRSAIHY